MERGPPATPERAASTGSTPGLDEVAPPFRHFPKLSHIPVMAITSINPATGEKLKDFSAFSGHDIEQRLERAQHAFEHHRRQPIPVRAGLMIAAASLLEREKKELAKIITLEMG